MKYLSKLNVVRGNVFHKYTVSVFMHAYNVIDVSCIFTVNHNKNFEKQ